MLLEILFTLHCSPTVKGFICNQCPIDKSRAAVPHMGAMEQYENYDDLN